LDINVYDKSFFLVGVIDTAKSVIWTERFYSCGDFEIYAKATTELFNICKDGYYVRRADEGYTYEEEAMTCMIDTILIKTDVENGNYMTVSGKEIKNIVSYRVVRGNFGISGTIYSVIQAFANVSVYPERSDDRDFWPYYLLWDYEHDGPDIASTTLDYNISLEKPGSVLEKIHAIGLTYGYRFYLRLNEELKIVVQARRGKDRSRSQSTLPIVEFSRENDSLISSDYKSYSGNYINSVYSYTMTPELEIIGIWVYREDESPKTGFYRRESIVEIQDPGPDTRQEALKTAGLDQMSERVMEKSFDVEINTNGYTYKKDYFLGDIVTVKNEYGISANPRILEVIISEDDTGYYVLPKFNDSTITTTE